VSVFGSNMTVSAAVDRNSVHPGDSVTVKVVISGQPDAKVQGARVELACKNRYREKERDYDSDGHSQTRTVTREHTVVAVWQPLPAAPDGPVAFGEHTITLQFPPDAPPTVYEPDGFGEVVTWEARAILDRRMAMDPDASIPIYVGSFPNQYAHWASSPPVAKSHEVPMAFDQLSTRVLRPGDQLTGVLTVNPRESAKGRSVRVQFERRRTDTPDNMEHVETSTEVELARDVKLEAGQPLQYPFQIPLPEGMPPTFAASRSYMHWYLEGIIDRKLRSDFVVEAEVVVYTGAPGAGPQAGAQPGMGQPGGAPQPIAPGFGQPVEMGAPGGFGQPGGGDAGYGQPGAPGQPGGAAPGGYAQPGGMQLPGGVQADPSGFQQPAGPQPIASPPAPPGGAPSAEALPGSFPADWYPDPWLQSRLRYWDGNAWTGHLAE
jgi:sporulation-control protein spo0M